MASTVIKSDSYVVWVVKNLKGLSRSYNVKKTTLKPYKLTFLIFLSCCVNIMFHIGKTIKRYRS